MSNFPDPSQTDLPSCSDHAPTSHGYEENKAKYLARLKRIEGQTRGIHRMVDEDQYCIDILTQVSAVTSALENVALALLQDHISHCVTGAAAESGEAADAKIAEAMKAIQKLVKS
ncbi:metal-sensitive transcriptional regulator [Corynebacterium alimapuense]|uniref:Transcriptional regulator n=1 Tax=Corynebacterium alimapuense TaxID=1576874 RepID=A0A3M8K9A8_9CORY|nr:metal-sensitive transcriptional regulator [Corynebacterium alimapuense]RNE49813.1 transcriptional regulator [Corynebacterium alimapuense]